MLLRAGRYETLRPIASGGMATVHLGRSTGAGGFERLVAIKIMHPHTAAEPEFVAMFLDEARLAARLHHPNVVATIDLVEDPLFLVMEFIDGPSVYLLLRALRKADRRLPIGVALRIFLDMLAGLHAAHDLTGVDGEPLNLVHRDVSPQNVLVGSDGISRITDFGVARAESRLSTTRGTGPKGKIGYMSPEQLKAEPVDRRSDVHSAGIVLWEMLAGRRLYEADNDGALITKMLVGPPGGPGIVNPEVPAPLDAVCMRALERDAAQRYPSAAAFAEATEHAAAAARVAIASNREVGALVRELGLRTTAEELMQPSSRGRAPSDPQFSSEPGSARLGLAAQTPLPSSTALPRLGSLADVLEPEGSSSSTRLSSVVTEPLRPRPSLVERRGLLVGVAVAALVVGGGLVLAVGKLGGGPDAARLGGAPAAPAATDAATATVAPTASAAAADPVGAPSASASAARPPPRSTSRVTGSPAWTPKTATPVPRPGATNFRPTEL